MNDEEGKPATRSEVLDGKRLSFGLKSSRRCKKDSRPLFCSSDLTEVLKKLADNLEHIRQTQADCLGGLFVFQESNGHVTDEAVLEELQRIVGGQNNRVINWVALSPDRFFRFWRAADEVPSIWCGDFWHSYKLCDGLAHAYFLSNVAWDVTKEPNHNMQYAWFPVEGGKEKFRQWCVSLQETNGEPKQFGNGGA